MFVKEANRALEEDKVKQENNIKFKLESDLKKEVQ